MIKINALIDLFFKDSPWEERVARIAQCGYKWIETWQGGDKDVLRRIAKAGRDRGVELISIVLNSPNDARAAPVNPANKSAFLERIDEYSDNALAAGCRQGIATTGPEMPGTDRAEQRAALAEALRAAAELTAPKGFKINLESLNTKVDHAGYYLSAREEAVEIVKEIGADNLRILYDIYHMQIMAGNQTDFILRNIEWIGHFHLAGVPGRHEVFDGELDYPYLLRKIEQTSYEGFAGLEYLPLLESRESLTKTLRHLRG